MTAGACTWEPHRRRTPAHRCGLRGEHPQLIRAAWRRRGKICGGEHQTARAAPQRARRRRRCGDLTGEIDSHEIWRREHSDRRLRLEGDPTKEGPFVVRFLFPDGYHVAPHTHPKTERVTVISGVLHLATGEALDRNSAKGLPAGSFGFWPAGMKHTAWSEGETIIQLHGVGPWQINYVNPADDPRKR